MRKNEVLFAVCLLSALLAAASEAAEAPAPADGINALAQWIPADPLLFLAYDGRNADLRKTAFFDLLNEPEVKAAWQGPWQVLRTLVTQSVAPGAGPDLDILQAFLETRFALAFINFAPPGEPGQPPVIEIAFVVEVGDGDDTPAARAVHALLDFLKNRAALPFGPFAPENVAGVPAQVGDFADIRFAHTTTRGYFLLGTGGALAKMLTAETPKLAASEAFQRARRLAGGSQFAILHYNHAAMMEKLGPALPRELQQFLTDPKLGLADLRSLTFTKAAAGKALKYSLFVEAPGERRGILKLLAGRPLDPAILQLAPRDAEFLFAQRLGPAALSDFLTGWAPAQAAPPAEPPGFDVRRDFIGSLGDEFAVFASPVVLAVKVKDPARFRAGLRGLVEVIEGTLEGPGPEKVRLELKTLPYQGRVITYIEAAHFPMFIQPCYALDGEYALLAFYPVSLKAYLAKKAEGGSILDNPDFRAAHARLEPGASAVYYANSKAYLEDFYQLLPAMVGLAKMAPDSVQPFLPDPAKMPPPGVISKHLFSCIASSRSMADGILYESYSPIGMPTPPALRKSSPMAAVPILAAMLMPSVTRARTVAVTARGGSRLIQIGHGILLWTTIKGDHRFYPPSLQALLDDDVLPNPSLFIHPGGDSKLQPGQFVCDFDSLLDLATRAGVRLTVDNVGPELMMAWDKRQFVPGGRSVNFADGHVRFLPEAEFQRRLEELKRWLAEQKAKAAKELDI